jgi:cyclopropane-fatty-acyl-phospholipid synthase
MSMFLLDAALKRLIHHGTLTLTEAGGRQRRYGTPSPGWPDLGLVLHDKGVPGKIARKPSLGFAEAYMDGRLDIAGGDIMDFVGFVRRNNPWDSGRDLDNPGLLARAQLALVGRINRINARAASLRNVAHHYDIDDRLYELFLDANRQYSCAYWADGITDLETAQVAKMNHIAAKLALLPGQRVLDIGCGWGGLAIHLHKVSGARVHGISLSKEQIGYARAWAEREGVADAVTFGLTDFRDVAGKFDRIVSVGMFEHVGTRNFPAFFRQVHDRLEPDGVMLLHTIGRAAPPAVTDDFTRKYIFPGGYIPSLSETVAAIEPCKLMLADCEVLRRHYAPTLRAWFDRCVAHHDRIVELFDERFYRMWLFYLAGAATGFEHASLVNFQLQLVRNRDAVPITRDYIQAAEARLNAGKFATNVVPLRRDTAPG